MTKSVFAYRNGVLCVEALPLSELAEEIDTPFFCTSLKQLHRNFDAFLTPFEGLDVALDYASCANGTLAVLRAFAQAGAKIDVSCAGEMTRALEASVAPHDMVLSGSAKTEDDVTCALVAGVARIKAESLQDLAMIARRASELEKKACVVLRVACDGSDSEGMTFPDISQALTTVLSDSFLTLEGFALPRKEGLGAWDFYARGIARLSRLARLVLEQGITVRCLGLGAGPTFLDDAEQCALYARLAHEELGDFSTSLFFEPGAVLVFDARALVVRVLDVKTEGARTINVVDAAFENVGFLGARGRSREILSVRQDATPARGALLAIMGVGAFGTCATPVSGGLALAPEILVSGARSALVRRRIAVAEQTAWECCPSWAEEGGARVA